ncbi:MAG TPA: type II and III secretion system protein family protein [Stellaceae bacterium]|nr:type II and III secretion system protein family protein [Stellaceae bacterium]
MAALGETAPAAAAPSDTQSVAAAAAADTIRTAAGADTTPAATPSDMTPTGVTPTETPPAAPASANASLPPVSQVRATGAPIGLEVGKGTLIRLNKPAATVFIANPAIADVQVKSPSLIYLAAKTPGETSVYAVDAADNVLLNSPVRVEHDLSRVRQSMHALMPGENISVSSVENSLVLRGDVSTAGRAEKARDLAASVAADVKGNVVNQLSVDTPNQVNLRVKIAEVNRTALKALGFNWSGNWMNNRLDHSTFNLATNNPVTNQAIINQNNFNYGFAIPGNGSLQAEIDALAQENLITTLAEPNLTATSGQTASFLAGGEFPVPVAGTAATGGGVPTITVEFKQFGVALDFTPTIIDATHLSLRVRPEVSQLSTTGAVSVPLGSGQVVTIPALTVRRADTTVDLASGQSFALAGLLQNTSEQDISKIPWLGDIPVLGQMFRSNLFQHNETELVIIVTPYLVKPSQTALAAPTDGFIVPHDAERYLNDEIYKQTLPGPERGPLPAGGAGLIGPIGFRLD